MYGQGDQQEHHLLGWVIIIVASLSVLVYWISWVWYLCCGIHFVEGATVTPRVGALSLVADLSKLTCLSKTGSCPVKIDAGASASDASHFSKEAFWQNLKS